MEKGIYLLNNFLKKLKISKSVLRIIGLNLLFTGIIFFFYYTVSLIIIDLQLEKNLDDKISHETEHILNAFSFTEDTLIVRNPNELNESDFISNNEKSFFLQLFNRKKEVVLQSRNLTLIDDYIMPLTIPVSDTIIFGTHDYQGRGMRTGTQKIYNEQGNLWGYIQLATPKIGGLNLLFKLIYYSLAIYPVIILLLILASLGLARKTFRPLNKIIDVAKKISVENISERIKTEADETDELGRLQNTFNSLLDRLEEQIKKISEFSDDASHQLMSPLSAFNSELEYLLKKERSKDEYMESIKVLKSQSDKMTRIISSMLMMAKDYNDCYDESSITEISEFIDRDVRQLFKNNNIEYELEKELLVRGSKESILIILQNLIENALKYSDENQTVVVKLHKSESVVLFSVSDQGIGIPDEEKQKIFQRFYRSKISDKMGIKGVGLGLSLVKSILDKMDCKIEVSDNFPKGTVFTVSFKELKAK